MKESKVKNLTGPESETLGFKSSLSQVEEVGTGTNRIINWCKEWELPEPEFGISGSSLFARFRKDILTEEYLREIGLNERQIKAVFYVKEKGKITNKEYRKMCNTSERTATRDLTDLVVRDILEQIGITGKGTSYTLKTPQRRQRTARTNSGLI